MWKSCFNICPVSCSASYANWFHMINICPRRMDSKWLLNLDSQLATIRCFNITEFWFALCDLQTIEKEDKQSYAVFSWNVQENSTTKPLFTNSFHFFFPQVHEVVKPVASPVWFKNKPASRIKNFKLQSGVDNDLFFQKLCRKFTRSRDNIFLLISDMKTDKQIIKTPLEARAKHWERRKTRERENSRQQYKTTCLNSHLIRVFINDGLVVLLSVATDCAVSEFLSPHRIAMLEEQLWKFVFDTKTESMKCRKSHQLNDCKRL